MDYAVIDTQTGPFSILVDADGAVIASGWTGSGGALASLAGLASDTPLRLRRDVGMASRAAGAWFAGDGADLAGVAVAQSSGEFIERAWAELRRTRGGEVLTYTELARRCNRPAAVRAAAQACARNACMLFVPCHRVLRTDGSLGGFRYGLAAKRWLLELEGAVAGAVAPGPGEALSLAPVPGHGEWGEDRHQRG